MPGGPGLGGRNPPKGPLGASQGGVSPAGDCTADTPSPPESAPQEGAEGGFADEDPVKARSTDPVEARLWHTPFPGYVGHTLLGKDEQNYPRRRARPGHNLDDLMWPWVGNSQNYRTRLTHLEDILPNYSSERARKPRDVMDEYDYA